VSHCETADDAIQACGARPAFGFGGNPPAVPGRTAGRNPVRPRSEMVSSGRVPRAAMGAGMVLCERGDTGLQNKTPPEWASGVISKAE
jgi:hypothetical protein